MRSGQEEGPAEEFSTMLWHVQALSGAGWGLDCHCMQGCLEGLGQEASEFGTGQQGEPAAGPVVLREQGHFLAHEPLRDVTNPRHG